jgi:septum formation protein
MRRPALILASASPRRVELLRQAGLEFTVRPAQVPESHPAHLTPHEVAQINACRKARAVARKHRDALVLGADTIVCLGQKIFGKPADPEEARAMLTQLSGRTHEVVTGVCLIHRRAMKTKLFAVATAVTFRRLSQAQIHRYLAKVNPLDKAGAYAIQEQGDLIVSRISGSYSNVVGLPMERVAEELARWEKS